MNEQLIDQSIDALSPVFPKFNEMLHTDLKASVEILNPSTAEDLLEGITLLATDSQANSHPAFDPYLDHKEIFIQSFVKCLGIFFGNECPQELLKSWEDRLFLLEEPIQEVTMFGSESTTIEPPSELDRHPLRQKIRKAVQAQLKQEIQAIWQEELDQISVEDIMTVMKNLKNP